MKRFLLFLFVIFGANVSNSQNKSTIDSINKIYVQGLNIPPDSIVSLYVKNAENAQKISYEEGVADAYSQLSLVYGYQGKYELSRQYVIKAIKIYEKLNLPKRIADYYAEMGYSMKYNDLQKAIEYMQKGKAIAETNGLDDILKDIYNNYGVLKEINRELDSALFYFEKGLKIKKRINDTIGIPYSWSNMAGVYALKGNFEKSREYFNRSLEQRLIWADSLGIAENYTQLGEVFIAENKRKKAIPLVHQSLPISIKKQYRNLTQYNYKLLSDIYKTLKNTDSALYYFEQYVAIKDSVHGIQVQEKIAKLNVEFETEKKQNEILNQKAQLVEKEIEVKRKNTLLYGSLGLAALLALLGYLLFNQQKLKNRQLQKEGELKTALAKIEMQNKLQEQRLRISRDLHDNIGSQLTFIISSIDNLKYRLANTGSEINDKLDSISKFAGQTIYELRDTIWAMNKTNISMEDLQSRISNFIEKAQVSSNTEFQFDIEKELLQEKPFTSVQGMNVYRIIQESVNNALKYSGATSIKVHISKNTTAKNNKIKVLIYDNGKGFQIEHSKMGNGLANIRKRAKELGGKVEVTSKENMGTTIKLTF